MQKGILYFLMVLTAFVSCRRDESSVFEISPDERINEIISACQSELVNAEYGWKALVYPSGAGGGVFLFYFRFNDSNRVEMFADIDSLSAVTPMESSYRLKALQQPSLLFDTYSYLHVLSDPDASYNGGIYGQGLKSDFEFAIENISGDSILLRGRLHGSRAVLVKATRQESQDFYNGKYGNRVFQKVSRYVNYFKKLVTGIRQYDINVNLATHAVVFDWINSSGSIASFTTGFYYSTEGIVLSPAFDDGNQTMAAFTGMSWDSVNARLSFMVNGEPADIQGSGKPLKVDENAPRRWWQQVTDQGSYWVSMNGFHVNGKEDAYGVRKMPDYYFLMFKPRYGISSGIAYDLAGYVKNNGGATGIYYGSAFLPPYYTTDGRVYFTYYGRLGTIPATDSAAVHETRIQFTEPNGYYLIRINDNRYDMVSAKDGKAWITWER